jgi:hypothetical protein
VLVGRYCHVCGQENTEPKETVWHLVNHFFSDITHFDGKFFSTVKYLLARPGLLSREYMNGRRASYLHPIRLYVFTSAFFFLMVFSFSKFRPRDDTSNHAARDTTRSSWYKPQRYDSLYIDPKSRVTIDRTWLQYPTVAAYDSAQRQLPDSLRDGWWKRQMQREIITVDQEYHKDPKNFREHFLDHFLHSFPKILFVSLPFFALILQFLYFRRRKQYYYADHGIFTIHVYCATFILMLLIIWLNRIADAIAWRWPGVVIGVLKTGIILYMFVYLFQALRTFYGQGRAKTLLKYLLLLIFAWLVITILLLLFLLISAISI